MQPRSEKPIQDTDQPFVTTTMHAANLLFESSVSAIWVIPKHTVGSLRSKLDSAYSAHSHDTVGEVVRVIRMHNFYRSLILIVCMIVYGVICMGVGGFLWERAREGVIINLYSPLALLRMLFAPTFWTWLGQKPKL